MELHESVGQDPPATKKDGLFKRFLKFLLPKKLHCYLTPEVFVAWNVSSWVTIGQVLVVQHWKHIAEWVAVHVAPKTAVIWKALKESVSDILNLLSHSQ